MPEPATDNGGTRQRLVAAAEKLFAARGYEETSIRDITDAAEANVAAINYHFGGKEQLYLEVFRRRSAEMREAREAALAAAEGLPGVEGVRALIRGFVCSILRRILSEDDMGAFPNLVFRELANPGPAFELMFREFVEPNHRALHNGVLRAFPELGESRASLCVVSVFGQMLHYGRARRMVARVLGRDYDTATVDEICDHIVEFSVRGMGAA